MKGKGTGVDVVNCKFLSESAALVFVYKKKMGKTRRAHDRIRPWKTWHPEYLPRNTSGFNFSFSFVECSRSNCTLLILYPQPSPMLPCNKVFDIPELLDDIRRRLSLKHIKACSLVCRRWNRYCSLSTRVYLHCFLCKPKPGSVG